jgi:hypothetical protein
LQVDRSAVAGKSAVQVMASPIALRAFPVT